MNFTASEGDGEDEVRIVAADSLDPGEVAEMDQAMAHFSELTSRVMLTMIIGLLLAKEEEPDHHAMRVNAAKLATELIHLERDEALGVINNLASTLSRQYIAEHGGPEATAADLGLEAFKKAAAAMAVDANGMLHRRDEESDNDDL